MEKWDIFVEFARFILAWRWCMRVAFHSLFIEMCICVTVHHFVTPIFIRPSIWIWRSHIASLLLLLCSYFSCLNEHSVCKQRLYCQFRVFVFYRRIGNDDDDGNNPTATVNIVSNFRTASSVNIVQGYAPGNWRKWQWDRQRRVCDRKRVGQEDDRAVAVVRCFPLEKTW